MNNSAIMLNRITNIITQYLTIRNQIIEEQLYSGIEINLSNHFLEEEKMVEIQKEYKKIELDFKEMVSLQNLKDKYIKELNLIEEKLLNILRNESFFCIYEKLVDINKKIMDIKDTINSAT